MYEYEQKELHLPHATTHHQNQNHHPQHKKTTAKKKGKPTKSEVFHKTYIQKYLTNCDYNMYNLSFNILTTLLLVVTYFRFFFSSNKINDV